MTPLRRPLSLKLRIAALVGLMVTVLWLGAALATGRIFVHEINEMFDRDLRASAERVLQIVLHDRDRDGDRPARELDHGDGRRGHDGAPHFQFQVTSATRGLLLRSAEAAAVPFPAAEGFSSDRTWRFYVDRARRGDVTIAVAEPLHDRRDLARAAVLGLSLPLLLVIPLTLAGIFLVVRHGLRPVEAARTEISSRGPLNLAPLTLTGLPPELAPVAEATNRLMARLEAAFAAERSFASNAAHELRTPVAGAIAQAQRLQAESHDPAAVARAKDIEATLKRLNRYGEKLMQMARAEGGRLRLAEAGDLAPVAAMIVQDFRRSHGPERVGLDLPQDPVLTSLDPDGFGILLRNLLENALRHGTDGAPVTVTLEPGRVLRVANDCDPIPPATLARLSQRFARGGGAGDGAGLGLSIAHVIAERSGSTLTLASPRPGSDRGLEVSFRF